MAVDTRGFQLRELWKHPGVEGSPVVSASVLWALAPHDGVLYALAPSSGRTLASVGVGPTTRFASPSLASGLVLVPTTSGVTAVAGG